jgi:hypothetical protein
LGGYFHVFGCSKELNEKNKLTKHGIMIFYFLFFTCSSFGQLVSVIN